MPGRDDNPYEPPGADLGPDAESRARRKATRDFGVLPGGRPASREPVRSTYKGIHLAMQWGCTSVIGGGMFLGGLALVAGGVANWSRLEPDARAGLFLGAAFLIGLAGGLAYAVADTNAWVELDGDTLRARRLFTGRVIERNVSEIIDVRTIVALVRTPGNRVAESLLGRIRGSQVRVLDERRGISVQQPEMDHVPELLEALYARMGAMGALETEVINLDGNPIVKRVAWKEPPVALG